MHRDGVLRSALFAARALGATLFGALLLASTGCIMDLPTGVVLERPRLLGVRVDVPTDPTRAEPLAGETVTLRWITDPVDVQWSSAMSACIAAESNQGIPSCSGAPFAFGGGPPSPAPSFEVALPAAAAGELLVIGVLCADGTPALPEGELPGCEGEDATTERLLFSVDVATDEASANRHPSLSDERFTIDEMPWDAPPASLPTDGCASAAGSPSLPTVALRVVPEGEDEVPSRVGFSTEAADRETFMELVYRDAPVLEERREELVVTHVATAGRFVRLTTEVFDDEQLVRDVPWRHPDPEEVPADGLLVRFVFIARDDRGGMDRVDRAFCLVPEGG